MNFYTSVNRFGNNLLVRGYNNNKRVKKKVKFSPTLYVKTSEVSPFVSLDGVAVKPKKFDTMKDAREFVERYKDIKDYVIYGNQNYIIQFIEQEYPGHIQYDINKIRIAFIDLEVNSSLPDINGEITHSFPFPEDAKHQITIITYYDSVTNTYYSWGTGDFDPTAKTSEDGLPGIVPIKYTKCDSETELLKAFLRQWTDEFMCPDIVTGYNIRNFDIPYLVNRIMILLGEDWVKKLSPWGNVQEKTVTIHKKQVQQYELTGISQLDYYDLFQKFGYSYGPQENYRLDTIARVVLGENKTSYEEEYETLANLYERNYQLYCTYNVQDVRLCVRLEETLGFIGIALNIAYKAGVNYSDAFGTTAVWDALIYRKLLEDNIIVPPNNIDESKVSYEGAFVKDPRCGMSNWVCSFDVNSLYPSIIVQDNMSYETIMRGMVDSSITVDSLIAGEVSNTADFYGASVAATGQLFSNDKQGFLPKIIEEMYDERVSIKKKMKKAKMDIEAINLELKRRGVK